jgi:hypothetical protein
MIGNSHPFCLIKVLDEFVFFFYLFPAETFLELEELGNLDMTWKGFKVVAGKNQKVIINVD